MTLDALPHLSDVSWATSAFENTCEAPVVTRVRSVAPNARERGRERWRLARDEGFPPGYSNHLPRPGPPQEVTRLPWEGGQVMVEEASSYCVLWCLFTLDSVVLYLAKYKKKGSVTHNASERLFGTRGEFWFAHACLMWRGLNIV